MMRRLAILLAAIGVVAAPLTADPAASASGIQWPQKYYDPAPAEGDLVLPLPCGGAMAFRPVEIPAGGLLDDRPVELGQASEDRGYKEGRRLSHLAGSFTEPDSSARAYYIAKYETTRDQYAALTADTCPRPNMRGRLPMTDVSWFDAVDYARRYTEWLLANAPDVLPREDQEPGFLRLPTEEEWEFAARGGLKVDETDFLAPVFPMPEGDLALYAWFESTRSAEGQLHPVGLLKPNPLGLYDVLGNASEMTLVPFHLDRRGRDHGQAGGFVSRGGDVFTPESQIGSAVRQEHNYFNATTGRARTIDSLGFRLVLTAPVIVSAQRLDAIKAAWSKLATLGVATAASADQALAELGQLADQSQDAALRSRLELIRRDMEKGQAELKESRQRALRAMLRMGAFLAKRVVTDRQRALVLERLQAMARDRLEQFIAEVDGTPGADAVIAKARASLEEKERKWQRQLEEINQAMAGSLSYYGDTVINLGRDYPIDVIRSQLSVVEDELRLAQQGYLIPYAGTLVEHTEAYLGQGKADKADWLTELLKLGAN